MLCVEGGNSSTCKQKRLRFEYGIDEVHSNVLYLGCKSVAVPNFRLRKVSDVLMDPLDLQQPMTDWFYEDEKPREGINASI